MWPKLHSGGTQVVANFALTSKQQQQQQHRPRLRSIRLLSQSLCFCLAVESSSKTYDNNLPDISDPTQIATIMNADEISASRDTPSSAEKDVACTENQEHAWNSESLDDPLGDHLPMTKRPILNFGGNPGDKCPANNGVFEVATALKMLEAAEVPCCVVAEPALLFYGAKRVMFVSVSQ
jgi:hypothetical protein